jgi:uncharacterized membrane protein
MRTRDFLNQLRHDDIVAAIRDAELRTSGELRVFVTRQEVEDPVAAAQKEFLRMGMAQTGEHNGVLIFVAPRVGRFAVVGDAGVHQKCGDAFWQELAAVMSGHFQKADFTQGIIHGIRTAGDLLAKHFPRRPDDRNELPDRVEQD